MMIGQQGLASRLTAVGNIHSLLNRLAVSVVREQKLLVPRQTGNLARSIHITSVTATRATIVATANYAAYTEFGTRAHDIVPVNKTVLRFAVGANRRLSGSPRKGSPVIFAKRVRHPGTRGTHWAERGAQKAAAGSQLANVVVEAWNGAA